MDARRERRIQSFSDKPRLKSARFSSIKVSPRNDKIGVVENLAFRIIPYVGEGYQTPQGG